MRQALLRGARARMQDVHHIPREHRTISGGLFDLFHTVDTEIDRSGFLPLLQDQKLLQNQKQKLLLDTGAPVVTGAPVHTGATVLTGAHVVTGEHVLLDQVYFCLKNCDNSLF